jgi:probable addiction module antidote protein
MKLKPFDAAKHLTTPEDIAIFLDESAKIGDPAVMIGALATVARAQNMSALARDAGITREGLYKALEPENKPAFATVAKIAGALGYRMALLPIETPESSVKKRPAKKRQAVAA